MCGDGEEKVLVLKGCGLIWLWSAEYSIFFFYLQEVSVCLVRGAVCLSGRAKVRFSQAMGIDIDNIHLVPQAGP